MARQRRGEGPESRAVAPGGRGLELRLILVWPFFGISTWDLCGDPKPPAPRSDHCEVHNRRRREIFLKGVYTFQNALNGFQRKEEGNQYLNRENRENTLQVPFVVSRKTEIQPLNRPTLRVESKFSLKLFSELFLGSLPVDE